MIARLIVIPLVVVATAAQLRSASAQATATPSRISLTVQAGRVVGVSDGGVGTAGELALQLLRHFSIGDATPIRFSVVSPFDQGFTRLDTGFNFGSRGFYAGSGAGISRFDFHQPFVFARAGYFARRSDIPFLVEARLERQFPANGNGWILVSLAFGIKVI